MDPVTAALIIGVLMSGTQMYLGVEAQKKQAGALIQQQAEQEAAREAQVRKEMGMVEQKIGTAFAGAGSRNKSAITPTSAIAQTAVSGDMTSVLGGLPSVQKAAKQTTGGTAGTF